MYRSFAGIGARATPKDVLLWMTRIAKHLDQRGWCLRSGGAAGADQAFLKGSVKRHEIYLPKNYFRGFIIDNVQFFGYTPEATEIAKKYHPKKWELLTRDAQNYHSRNVHQVLGRNLDDPSEFVICWTEDGEASGGTGQAIRVARGQNRKIPIYNLQRSVDTLPIWISDLK